MISNEISFILFSIDLFYLSKATKFCLAGIHRTWAVLYVKYVSLLFKYSNRNIQGITESLSEESKDDTRVFQSCWEIVKIL